MLKEARMKQELILVVGATGQIGSELSKILKADGHKVREANSKTLNTVTGAGLSQAFEGVTRAFFLSPPGIADQYKTLAPLIQEAKRRGLKKAVLMTAMGANAVETSPFRRAEIELEKSGLAYNIIRPNWFMQNFNTFWIQGILQQNKILLPAGSAKVSFIDTRDIAAVAAKLLVSDSDNNQAFDLSGPEAIDHAQVASAIANVTGKEITYQEISAEDLKKGLLAAGVPADYTEFLLMIFGFLKEGYNAGLTPHVKNLTRKNPRSIEEYAQDYKTFWK